jgi:hypothetical protein
MTSVDDLINTPTNAPVEVTEVVEPMPVEEFTATLAPAAPVEKAPEPAAEAPAPEAPQSDAEKLIAKLFSRIKPVKEVSYRKMFLYGPPGCGKTVFSATAPRPLIVRVEPTGASSLLNHPDLMDKVETFEFLNVTQLEVLIQMITDYPEKFDMFDTLVVDSLSELSRLNLDAIIAREAAADSSRNKYMRTWPDYNENTIHMSQLVGKLTALPMHVIATCHRKEKEDKNKGSITTQPSLTDVLAEACAGFFDVMAYMQVDDNGKRSIQMSPTKGIVAKTRVGGLPAVIEEPTWDKLFGHLA